jgi:hypothetical protein
LHCVGVGLYAVVCARRSPRMLCAPQWCSFSLCVPVRTCLWVFMVSVCGWALGPCASKSSRKVGDAIMVRLGTWCRLMRQASCWWHVVDLQMITVVPSSCKLAVRQTDLHSSAQTLKCMDLVHVGEVSLRSN